MWTPAHALSFILFVTSLRTKSVAVYKAFDSVRERRAVDKATRKTLNKKQGDKSRPAAAIDQSTIKKLKGIADQKGLTVEGAINEALVLFLARHQAKLEAKAKIIRFPNARQSR
jgi:hypothetical protein